jgi:protein-S-isoprenylcysteine O-methyltransferase Ste14
VQVIHHADIATIRQIIQEITRVLKPGGLLFVTVPRLDEGGPHAWWGTDFEQVEPHTFLPLDGPERGLLHHYFTPEELHRVFGGFDITDMHVDSVDHHCVLGFKHQTMKHRDDLTGEHALGDAGQLVLALLFAATWIADTCFLECTTFLNRHVPRGIRIPLGVALLVASGYLAREGLSIVFGEERGEPGVIRKGVFSVVRHPIYLGEILAYLGFLILSLSLAAAVVWAIAIAFLHFISRYEEKLLLARFGEAYEAYMRDVPMWVPRPWK